MNKAACSQCPFRIGSEICYDADAIEALDDGAEPSCHMVVGMSSIFFNEPPTHKQRCHGHALWIAGVEGYREPSGTGSFRNLDSVDPAAALKALPVSASVDQAKRFRASKEQHVTAMNTSRKRVEKGGEIEQVLAQEADNRAALVDAAKQVCANASALPGRSTAR